VVIALNLLSILDNISSFRPQRNQVKMTMSPGQVSLSALFQNYGLAATLFFAFCLLHTGGADESFKTWLTSKVGPFFVEYFWRVTYCIGSWVLLYPLFFHQFYNVDPQYFLPLATVPTWWFPVDVLLMLLGVIITYWAFFQFDYLSFVGLRQMWRGIEILRGKKVDESNLSVAGVDRLEIRGIYKLIRHPMLTGALLLTIPRVVTVNSVAIFFFITTYVAIGSYIEERRLIKNFGRQYLDYKASVGAFFPKLKKVRSA
jgi:hypothetical protein